MILRHWTKSGRILRIHRSVINAANYEVKNTTSLLERCRIEPDDANDRIVQFRRTSRILVIILAAGPASISMTALMQKVST